jgi:hypothetical protein
MSRPGSAAFSRERAAQAWLRRALALLLMGGAVACGLPPPDLGFAVALDVQVDESVDDATLGSVVALLVRASGDETYDHIISLDRALQRDERFVYRPSPSSRSITIEVLASDATLAVVAQGDSGPLQLQPNGTISATITLGREQADAGVADLRELDGSDAAIKDGGFVSPYRAAVLLDHPLAYYRLDEAAGPTAVDETAHAISGTYFGNLGFHAAGALVGDPNHALRTNPEIAGLSAASMLFDFSGTRPFSVEAWVSPVLMTGAYRHVFDYDTMNAQGRQGFGMFLDASAAVHIERWVNGMATGNNSAVLSVGQFAHLVMVYDGTVISLYVNGVLAASAADMRSAPTANVAMLIGASSTTCCALSGTLDEPAIYDYALSPQRVSAHYNAGKGL